MKTSLSVGATAAGILPGMLLCLAVALPSYFLGNIFPIAGGPVFAILIGMLAAIFIKKKDGLKNGLTFCSKKVLQYAVILLGFGMNIGTILEKGAESLPVILSTISAALISAFITAKLLGIPRKISILIGVGSSICGGSAIAAAAPVVGADDDEIARSISVIFLFNVIAAIIFPSLGALLGLSNEGFSLFAGTAVNDTSSVTAAASAWDGIHDSDTLSGATVVKLTRTLAIIPITIVLAVWRMRTETKKPEQEENKAGAGKFSFAGIFPWFILWFVAASIVTTIFNLQSEITSPLKWLSKFFIILAMSAIGLNTNIVELVKKGGKPILLGFICWICVSVMSLFIQHILKLW